MGQVFRAMDLRLEREVAIKVISWALEKDPESLMRFEREAKLLAALQHPAILTVHDFLHEEGMQAIVTELLEGETLEQRLKRGPLPLEEALAMGIQLAEGLAAAHERGVIHRDLKPANIFLTEQGEAKLLDFGLARLAIEDLTPLVPGPPALPSTRRDGRTQGSGRGSSGPARSTSSRGRPTLPPVSTEVDFILGTLDYMSPEQCLGRALDARSDVFSFGTLLLETLSGVHPFPGVHRLAIIDALLTKTPEALEDPDLPKDLRETLRRAMAKDRDLRHPSARELLEELEALKRRLDRRPLLRRMAWGMAGLLFLGVGLGGAVWVRQLRAPVDSLAVLPLVVGDDSRDLDYLAKGVAEQVRGNLSRLPDLRVLGSATTLGFKNHSADPAGTARELGVGAVLTGRVQRVGDKILLKAELTKARDGSQIWGEQYLREASDFLGLQDQISREIAKKLREKLGGEELQAIERRGTRNSKAYEAFLKGRLEWSKRTPEGLLKAQRHYEESLERDPTFSGAWSSLGELHLLLDNGPKAKEEARRALELDPKLGDAHAVLGLVALLHDWNPGRSEEEFKKALASDPGNATAHHWYALMLGAAGRFPEARSEFAKALRLEPESMGIQCDSVIPDLQEQRLKVAEIRMRALLKRHPEAIRAYKYLGLALLLQNRYQEAAEMEEVSMGVVDDAFSLGLLGYCQGRMGQRDRWEVTQTRLKALERKGQLISYWQAMLYLGLGDREGALTWLEKAAAERSVSLIVGISDLIWEPLRGEARFKRILEQTDMEWIINKSLSSSGR